MSNKKTHRPTLKIAIRTIATIFFYLLVPASLTLNLKLVSPAVFSLYVLVNIVIICLLVKKNFGQKYHIQYEIDTLNEKLNILFNQNSKETRSNLALQAKIIRYNSLHRIVEELNEKLDLDSVTDGLTSTAFSLIANHKGNCILYLVDNQTQGLGLFKARKENRDLIIKAKEGDIFDYWVMKHGTSLLIEDIKADFRFDTEKLKSADTRPIVSLISSALINDYRLLGILRLDNPSPNIYSQEDLRFLVTICDLGAVALENAVLFEETQELAIRDSLTSLFTKAYFLERLKEECKRATRQKETFSLLFLDIDFFKKYNDNFGHIAGDLVLSNLSRIMTEYLSEFSPILSRFGGEEFCVILPVKNKQSAYSIACRLRKRIEEEEIILRRQKTNITVSIGVANFPSDASDEESLIVKADKAMYDAKQAGRNRVKTA